MTTTILLGVVFAANAQGFCRVGEANFSPNPNGTTHLSCPGDGICYETDAMGNTSPGSIIIIHWGTERIPAVIMSAPPTELPPDEIPSSETTDLLPEYAEVMI